MSKSEDNIFESAGDRRERERFAPIEAMVRAAGGYVRPSDDLRPSTLEAARRSCKSRRWSYRLCGAAAMVAMLAAFNVPGRFASPMTETAFGPETVTHEYEVRHQAAKGMGFGFNPAWAWYEAFLELRNKQSQRIND